MNIRTPFPALALLLALLMPAAQASAGNIETGLSGAPALSLLPALPVPADNPQTAEKIALGKKLFFDPILSGDNSISCATCHDPGKGWGDKLPRAFGVPGEELGRNTPHLFNTAWQQRWFWDGRAVSLEEQSLGPIQAAGEMSQELHELVSELNQNAEYRQMFSDAFAQAAISPDTIGKAIAAFERTIISSNSPFEKYLKGDSQALNASAKRGTQLFKGKARCVLCHNGPNLTDNGFHNIGVAAAGPAGKDAGRYAILPLPSQRGSFKTPGLHSVALTAPFMHNGSIATLKQVILFYNRGGDVKENIDPQIVPLQLTQLERDDLLAFLHALTGIEETE
ncbi:cytochrome c peroxidase [Mariprofundus micogutta]|uniref:Methylamine utilization protein MauG n=1 Tax=Mariprofundus micogutta TaxID=1921010 RepID=A0A1L8CLA0_9PROT|nr:cytochrome c peroxidase [Mariprofundus micogutta]GAV19686.1 cytochrome c peroxidase [Mariprofundus micogutta]